MNHQGTVKAVVASAYLLLVSRRLGHHSYAMFDGSKTLTVSGIGRESSTGRIHTSSSGCHVPNPKAPTGYDLYAFSTASTKVLGAQWLVGEHLEGGREDLRSLLAAERGRTGGQFIKAIHEDGHVTWGTADLAAYEPAGDSA